MNGEEWRKRICMETDTGYSYSLAKRMDNTVPIRCWDTRTGGVKGRV